MGHGVTVPFLFVGVAVLILIIYNSNKNDTTASAFTSTGQPASPQPGDPNFVGPAQQANANAAAFQLGAAIGGATTAGLLALHIATKAAGPIGLAVDAAVIIIMKLRTYGHLAANEFVQQIQNPFGRALAQIVDWNDNLVRQGQQTPHGAQQALDYVSQLWVEFQTAAARFVSPDHPESDAVVIRQAFAELNGPTPAHNPPYFMNLVISNLQRDVVDLSTGQTPRAR